MGWKSFLGLRPAALRGAAQRGLQRLGGPVVDLAERVARGAQRVGIGPRLARGRVVAGPSKKNAARGQNSSRVEIFSWAIATTSRAQLAARQRLEAAPAGPRRRSSRR